MRIVGALISIAATLVLAPVAGAATQFNISGGGYGHGIGMSQYGAYGYALHGKDYKFILAHYYQGTLLGSADPNQTVRVLIDSGTAGFGGATSAGKQKLDPATTYTVRALADGTLTLLDASGKKVGHYSSPLSIGGTGPLSVVGHGAYRGTLEFRAVGSGVQTVNAIGLDDYVRGVIAAEMPSSWPIQALEAQAVAARTYAITSDVGGNGYQLYPDTRSQMYGGVAAETPATDTAVAATRGQVVTYGGIPVTTFFFSSSGGHTENIENVWLGSTPAPWLKGVPDPYDGAGANPYYRWTQNLTLAQAGADLGSMLKGQLVGIRITVQGVSPRVVTAEVVGTKGQTSVSGSELEGAFALSSTYMAFTTITTDPALPSIAPQRALRASRLAAAEAAFAAAVRTPRGIAGNVFPGAKGAHVSVELRTAKGWRTVATSRLGAGGAYAVPLAAPGSYRVLYHGVLGPAVTVG
jgi:stage II sporulation protein D